MKSPVKTSMLRRLRAFTVIELLVAVGVTALLVSLMLTIVVNVMSGWNRSSGSLSAGNQARLVLDQVARDLQSAIIKRDGNGWLVATVQQNQTGVGLSGVSDAAWVSTKPSTTGTDPTITNASFLVPAGANPAIDDYRFGQGGVWLRFFSSVAGANALDSSNTPMMQTLSAPRAVAYQIVRLPVVPGSAEVRYQLFRSEVRPGHREPVLAARSTFAVGYDLLDAGSLYNNPNNNNDRGSKNFGVLIENSGGVTVDQGGEPGSIRRPDRNQLIANNVIDFGVRLWTRNASNQLVISFPTSTTNVGFAATSNPAAPISGYNYGFPEVAEVMVRVLTDEGVLLISNLEAGLIAGDWWEIALANSRVYSRRVEIKGRSL